MQYEFVDTVQPEEPEERGRTLPAEAMQFNGEYLEDVIDGYRTLYVRGRESMLAEINAYETGVRDGTGITSKRFPARELVIGYLLKADTNEAFREAYNALNGILNTQDAQIIFHDEEDKYFTGTPEGLDEIESGRNFVQGEIIIYCADPFKYGLEEIEVYPDSRGVFDFEYAGTYKTFPKLEADFNSDCGYASWFNQNNKIIQVGDANESEGESYTTNEVLGAVSFYSASSVDSALSTWGWTKNAYDIHLNYVTDWGGMGGDLILDSASGSKYLTAENYIDWSKNTGCSISLELWEDANGDKGATNWTFDWQQRLSISNAYSALGCRSGIEIIISDASDNIIAGVHMGRSLAASSASGDICMYVNNLQFTAGSMDYSYGNSNFGTEGDCKITKSGSTVTFRIGNNTYSTTNSSIANSLATRVTIIFCHFTSYTPMIQGIYGASFTKISVSRWRDLVNSFTNGDVAIADCGSGVITVNKSEDASYGIIENNWETFYLEPGANKISFNYSSWVATPPTSTIRYREVFV